MCSWGHVAKNSTACSHEWRAHSTIALVFSTKTWHGQKRSSSGHGHKCQGWVYSNTNTGWWAAKSTLGFTPIWINLLNHCPLFEHSQENVTWKEPSECHDIPCFLFVAQQHPCWIQSFPPWSNSLPCLSWVTALPLWHNSSIWFHLTGAMNNLTGGIIIPASSTSLAITRSLGSAISVAG